MVQVTERARVELRRLLSEHSAQPHQGVRLRLDSAGDLAMTIDSAHSGDSVIRRDHLTVLIVDARLSASLAQRVLDFPVHSQPRGGFTLAWRNQDEAATPRRPASQ